MILPPDAPAVAWFSGGDGRKALAHAGRSGREIGELGPDAKQPDRAAGGELR